MASIGKMYATRLPLRNSGRPCSPGSMTRNLLRPTTPDSTEGCSKPAAPSTEFVRYDYRSSVRSSWHAGSGASTRHDCPMSAGGSASRCATMNPVPMRKHARESCLRPRLMDGGEWRPVNPASLFCRTLPGTFRGICVFRGRQHHSRVGGGLRSALRTVGQA